MSDYWLAPEVEEIANDLIAQYHTHLASARIGYLFREKAERKKVTLDGSVERVTQGKAGKVGSKKYEVLCEKDFIIEIAADEWLQASTDLRKYIVDHELCHCAGEEDPENGEMVWFTVPHDLEEFVGVVDRHGLQRDVVRDFYRACAKADEIEKKKIYGSAVLAAADTAATGPANDPSSSLEADDLLSTEG